MIPLNAFSVTSASTGGVRTLTSKNTKEDTGRAAIIGSTLASEGNSDGFENIMAHSPRGIDSLAWTKNSQNRVTATPETKQAIAACRLTRLLRKAP